MKTTEFSMNCMICASPSAPSTTVRPTRLVGNGLHATKQSKRFPPADGRRTRAIGNVHAWAGAPPGTPATPAPTRKGVTGQGNRTLDAAVPARWIPQKSNPRKAVPYTRIIPTSKQRVRKTSQRSCRTVAAILSSFSSSSSSRQESLSLTCCMSKALFTSFCFPAHRLQNRKSLSWRPCEAQEKRGTTIGLPIRTSKMRLGAVVKGGTQKQPAPRIRTHLPDWMGPARPFSI
ncbi:hypothetical protein SAMN04244571_01314 [Azotobacter beijerinckii]|uniref:Uncharacterized protein n=1 Tax=Azotobacter beijerinckii TaxID=170623 RepID=A0A1I0Y162_9GAMM|nr:hypothetical protein SAMN04244571_01314 [Azotobacter beijerinckii]